MKLKEDLLTVTRGILKRPVESLLLIFGIALGIGATASGLSIVFRTMQEARATLAETRYREIVVSARESTAEMELPVTEVGEEEDIVLTANDLSAAQEVPAVQYAYVANRERIRFFGFGRDRNAQRSQTGTNSATSEATDTGSAATGPPANTDAGAAAAELPGPPAGDGGPPPGDAGFGGPPEGMGDFFQTELDPEATQPALEEIDAMQVSPAYFPAYDLSAAQGSLFTADDINRREPLMILGAELGKTLFEDGVALDRKVQVFRDLYSIIGILEPTGSELDSYAFIPVFPPAEGNLDFRLRFRGWNTSLRFTVSDVTKLDEAKEQLTTWFAQKYGTGRVIINVPREEAQALADRNSRLVTIILILALSGLLIASVNVSNILYSRAIRKRKAIGILKALGATRRHIFRLFFTEALIVGIGGALAGTGVAVLLSGMMQSSLGIGGYSLGVLGLGVLLSLATTLFLTNIPAMQTSKIPASEAIRYE